MIEANFDHLVKKAPTACFPVMRRMRRKPAKSHLWRNGMRHAAGHTQIPVTHTGTGEISAKRKCRISAVQLPRELSGRVYCRNAPPPR